MKSGTLRVNKDVEMDGHGIYLLLDKLTYTGGLSGEERSDWRLLIIEQDPDVDPMEGTVEWVDERWLLEWTRPYLRE